MKAIDQMWNSLEHGTAPRWFSGNSAIDLDSIRLDPERSPISSASETHPPVRDCTASYWSFGLAAIAVAVPLAFLMDQCAIWTRIDVMLSLAVCAAAIGLGRGYALTLAFISGFVVNFFAMPPLMSFSIPTPSEIAYVLMNICAAVMIPKIVMGEIWNRGLKL
ncbi:DUF4118 domain-containing protein [Bradyrhizobium sp. SZCCHNR3118]|uniref:DUF4118 domain-containing protein n=1 Tax=Bradyrhizobium sp. SZCCHNR3118 TaxID=3057468 RepID=UPI00291710FC|nr:DUF4118 domain-containing protein [Bradyrhizobium sp. SZCCHNR3118]